MSLSWEAVSGATGYRVYRSANGAPATAIGDVTTTAHTDTTVTNDTTYNYTVATLNAAGEGTPSTPATATPTAPTPDPDPDPEPSVIPIERNSQLTSVHFRMAWIQPVSSRRESSAAMANANGIVMLMYPR